MDLLLQRETTCVKTNRSQMHICLFDIDGTLLKTGGAGQAAMEAAMETEFGVRQPVEGISTAGRTDRAITADIFAFHGLDNSPENCERFLSSYLKHLPDHLEERDGTILPGVQALLNTLSARGDVLLGLLTGNYREGAQIKLGYYRLDTHFRFGGFGDRHHHRNDVAREALDEVHRQCDDNAELQRLWVIGDTPADIECGRTIGANVVAVGTGMYSLKTLEAAGPDHLFADLSDLDPLLDLLR